MNDSKAKAAVLVAQLRRSRQAPHQAFPIIGTSKSAALLRSPVAPFGSSYAVEKVAALPSLKVLGEFFSRLSAKPIVSDALRVAHGTTENLATGSSLSLAALSALGEHAAPRVAQKVAPAFGAVTRTLSPYHGLNQMAGRNWHHNPLSPLNING